MKLIKDIIYATHDTAARYWIFIFLTSYLHSLQMYLSIFMVVPWRPETKSATCPSID